MPPKAQTETQPSAWTTVVRKGKGKGSGKGERPDPKAMTMTNTTKTNKDKAPTVNPKLQEARGQPVAVAMDTSGGGGGGGGGGPVKRGREVDPLQLPMPDGRDPSLPWTKQPNRGAYTNAPRPAYPKVFRPYGHNTRQRVVGDRSHITHMHHGGYAKGIVESLSTSSLLTPHAALGQSGAPSLLAHIPALRAGPSHLLFSYR